MTQQPRPCAALSVSHIWATSATPYLTEQEKREWGAVGLVPRLPVLNDPGESTIGPVTPQTERHVRYMRRSWRSVFGRQPGPFEALDPRVLEAGYYDATRRSVVTPLGGAVSTVHSARGVDTYASAPYVQMGATISTFFTEAHQQSGKVQQFRPPRAGQPPPPRPGVTGSPPARGPAPTPPLPARVHSQRMRAAQQARGDRSSTYWQDLRAFLGR